MLNLIKGGGCSRGPNIEPGGGGHLGISGGGGGGGGAHTLVINIEKYL